MQEQFQPVPKAIEVSQRKDKQRFDDPIFDSTIQPIKNQTNTIKLVLILHEILTGQFQNLRTGHGKNQGETKKLMHRQTHPHFYSEPTAR